jgi:hypothetical protein
MSWRERRVVTILSGVLLILCAALLVVLGIRYRAHRDADTEMDEQPAVELADPEDYVSLTFTNSTATLSFSQDEDGNWIWDGDPAFPLDPAVVQTILETLSVWAPQQILTDDESLENSGLSDPVATLTAFTQGGVETSVLFGKATTDGTSRYVRYNGNENTVYIIDGGLYQLLQTPIYDMCHLPELPELDAATLHTVTVRGAADGDEEGLTTVLTALRTTEGGAVTWYADGADVTEEPLVTALLADLAALEVTRCVDYRPSDEAASICGFDAPSATLEVTYAGDDAAEQTLTLTIGQRLLDGSGRYVRIGEEDTSIYLLETELLDPLMSISANGLAA